MRFSSALMQMPGWNPQRTARARPKCLCFSTYCFVSFYVLFVCKCVLFYCHCVSTQLCCSVYCLCVNVYCTTATVCQPKCVVLCTVCV
jgi:hypothetical protein